MTCLLDIQNEIQAVCDNNKMTTSLYYETASNFICTQAKKHSNQIKTKSACRRAAKPKNKQSKQRFFLLSRNGKRGSIKPHKII